MRGVFSRPQGPALPIFPLPFAALGARRHADAKIGERTGCNRAVEMREYREGREVVRRGRRAVEARAARRRLPHASRSIVGPSQWKAK